MFLLLAVCDLLEFNTTVGNGMNYFIQNENGSFHILSTFDVFSRIIIASPAWILSIVFCKQTINNNRQPVLLRAAVPERALQGVTKK